MELDLCFKLINEIIVIIIIIFIIIYIYFSAVASQPLNYLDLILKKTIYLSIDVTLSNKIQ